MKHLMIRGAISIALMTSVLLIASSCIREAGMAGPRNPAWVFIQDLLTAELYIAKILGLIILLAVLGAGIVIAFDYFFVEPKTRRQRLQAEKQKAAIDAIRSLEIQMRWKKKEEEEEAWRIRRQIEAAEAWKKREAEKEARLRARSPEQVKADAIHEITKGW